MNKTNQQSLTIDSEPAGVRLDAFLAAHVPEVSRSAWKACILDGRVRVNGDDVKPNRKLSKGDTVEWMLPAAIPAKAIPENIPLHILFEDASVIVLNKPAGLVVHPAVGNSSGTLLHGLLFHEPSLHALERAGIVHRLDKDTSGVMVVAKNEAAQMALQQQFKDRTTKKEYLALVWGEPPATGKIETLLGRHPVHRKKQAVLQEEGRQAVTHYTRLETFEEIALMRIGLETGRTHQIRVHMAHIGHPVVGDRVYGRARKNRLPLVPDRQMLHAARLEFNHPQSGKRLSFEAPLHDDMRLLLEALRKN